jgi:hypothetical protein
VAFLVYHSHMLVRIGVGGAVTFDPSRYSFASDDCVMIICAVEPVGIDYSGSVFQIKEISGHFGCLQSKLTHRFPDGSQITRAASVGNLSDRHFLPGGMRWFTIAYWGAGFFCRPERR